MAEGPEQALGAELDGRGLPIRKTPRLGCCAMGHFRALLLLEVGWHSAGDRAQRTPHWSSACRSLMLPSKVISVPSWHDVQMML